MPTTATEPQVLPKAGPASAETNTCQTIPNNSPESLLTFSSWLLRNHFLFRRYFMSLRTPDLILATKGSVLRFSIAKEDSEGGHE
jgi:hypothetical protein